jgi:hypothetical protein
VLNDAIPARIKIEMKEEEEKEKEKLDYNGKGFKIGDLVEDIDLLDSMRFGIVTAVKPEDISTGDVLNYFNHFHGVEEASIDILSRRTSSKSFTCQRKEKAMILINAKNGFIIAH